MLTLTENKLINIFIDCDDFMKDFLPMLEKRSVGSPKRPVSGLSVSEIVTICICYHFSRKDCFKTYYIEVAKEKLGYYFPELPSYAHFIHLKRFYVLEMTCFLLSRMARTGHEANFIDSKKLPSCHIKRERSHKVMKGLASKGKTSTGWFFGLKLHLIINQYAELCRFMVTKGSVSDNNEEVLKTLFKGLKGNFFGDKGYLTKLKEWLGEQGVNLITKVRDNMKPLPLTIQQKHYLRHRGLIETVFALLTFQADIDHTRHRSQSGMIINLMSGLLAYTYFDVLPRLKYFEQSPDIVLF